MTQSKELLDKLRIKIEHRLRNHKDNLNHIEEVDYKYIKKKSVTKLLATIEETENILDMVNRELNRYNIETHNACNSDLKLGQVVLVRVTDQCDWELRQFHSFDTNGRIRCCNPNDTLLVVENDYTIWGMWMKLDYNNLPNNINIHIGSGYSSEIKRAVATILNRNESTS